MRKFTISAGLAILALAIPSASMADTIGPINFEAPTYTTGSINGQNGWSMTGGFDATIQSTSGIKGFGMQALQISNAVTSGSFGDQTISPGLARAASDAAGSPHHFEGEFTIYAGANSGRAMSVSPDNGFSQTGYGPGGRMSYLRFVDGVKGVDVYFDEYRNNDFVERDIATLSYGKVHHVKFDLNLKRDRNDEAKVTIDGKETKGTTWEQYYLYDPEAQAWQDADLTPTVDALLFREAGTAVPANFGNGYLINGVKLKSS